MKLFNSIFLLPMLFFGFTGEPSSEFQQLIDAFVTDHKEKYELKTLNVKQPNIGDIENTSYYWKREFYLKSHEKMENNLGQKRYQKLYIGIFGYETETDRKYALKYWMDNFIEGESIRRSRMVRNYKYATPTHIMINDKQIIIANFKCKDYDYDQFDYWGETLEKYFGEDESMMIEVECDGPLEWTKNAPDPKSRDLF